MHLFYRFVAGSTTQGSTTLPHWSVLSGQATFTIFNMCVETNVACLTHSRRLNSLNACLSVIARQLNSEVSIQCKTMCTHNFAFEHA